MKRKEDGKRAEEERQVRDGKGEGDEGRIEWEGRGRKCKGGGGDILLLDSSELAAEVSQQGMNSRPHVAVKLADDLPDLSSISFLRR
eukprot:564476-Hanusia_phi.AAC.6